MPLALVKEHSPVAGPDPRSERGPVDNFGELATVLALAIGDRAGLRATLKLTAAVIDLAAGRIHGA